MGASMSTRPPRPSERALHALDAAGEKDIGARDHDEDAFLVRPDLPVFAVADGAGGENAGNVAASIALASLARHFEETKDALASAPVFDLMGLPLRARRLATAIQRANREVSEIARSSDRYRGMGTTLVAIAPDLVEGVVHIGHVGDSRCYRLRSGRLELLTQDHSLAQDVLELKPDVDEATQSALPRHVITRALGMSENVRVSVRSLDVALGDRYLLCSDGLTDVLSDEEIAETLIEARSPRSQAAALVARAKASPADDNVAVVVVLIDAAPGVAIVPKRHVTRPAPPKPDDESWEDIGEGPEIILVESDRPRADTSPPSFHVVPRMAKPRSLSALTALVVPKSRSEAPAPELVLEELDEDESEELE